MEVVSLHFVVLIAFSDIAEDTNSQLPVKMQSNLAVSTQSVLQK